MKASSPLQLQQVRCDAVPQAPEASWSNCLVVGREVVFSGVTARGVDGFPEGGASLQGQTEACFRKILLQLEAAGGHLGNLYKLVIYVTEVGRKNEVNSARKQFFRETYPCSTLLGVSGFAFPDLLVEVDAFANLDANLHGDVE
ncbi:MAG: RidA family protein [bacterium]